MEEKDDGLQNNFVATKCSIWGVGTTRHCLAPFGTIWHRSPPFGTVCHHSALFDTVQHHLGAAGCCWAPLGTFLLILQLVTGNHYLCFIFTL